MESDRFDALTRSVASRRSFMTKAGTGGLGAALLATLGLREEAAAATSCLLDVRLFVRVGPSAGFPLVANQTKTGQLVGQLRLKISSKGDLGGSTFALADGSSFPVVGSVSSHLIGLRIALAHGRTLVLQGVDEGAVTACKGVLDGSVVGPQEGDLGDWHATVVPTTTQPTATAPTGNQSVAPTPVPANSSGASGSSQPSDTPPSTATTTSPPTTTQAPTTTAAPTPTPTEIACPECQAHDGFNGGSPFCTPVGNNTPCSAGVCCDGVCGDLSANPVNCGTCGNVCASGCCQGGVCCVTCPSGQTDCDGTCVNLSTDRNNCGACGNVCDAGAVCTGGSCKKIVVCPSGWINCGGTCFHGKVCP